MSASVSKSESKDLQKDSQKKRRFFGLFSGKKASIIC